MIIGCDPDDIQSLIHLLHYSDVLRLEGIVSSPGPGSSPDAENIRLYYIGLSNTTTDPASRDYVYEGMDAGWPDLWWIENGILPKFSHDTFRGYYMGGDRIGEWGNKAFVDDA